MWSAVRQKGTGCTSRMMCTGLKGSVTKSCKFISKPNDIHAVGIGIHHVCLQNLMAGAAHVSMSDDTETGKL